MSNEDDLKDYNANRHRGLRPGMTPPPEVTEIPAREYEPAPPLTAEEQDQTDALLAFLSEETS